MECGKLYLKVCEYCGAEFRTKCDRAKFCSGRCKSAAANQKRRRPKICAGCGAEFFCDIHMRAAKYCPECRAKAKKHCPICGAELPKWCKIYCSEECARESRRREYAEALSTGKDTLSTVKKPLEHGCDLVSIAKAALEHHMTYGKYVEMLEKAHEHGV